MNTEIQDRFHQMLAELRQDREIQTRKWEEHDRKFDEYVKNQNRKWNEQIQRLDEHIQEQNYTWEHHNRIFDEYTQEQNRKWNNDQEQLNMLNKASKRLERTMGALGARWGMKSERSFRRALAGILEENFEVQVLNINEYDDTGEVFGRPDQIELDIIIKNGLLIICELKSSIDKSGISIFERKARFYEKRHQRKANKLIVISPMIDDKAQKLANILGIEVFHDSLDVKSL